MEKVLDIWNKGCIFAHSYLQSYKEIWTIGHSGRELLT